MQIISIKKIINKQYNKTYKANKGKTIYPKDSEEFCYEVEKMEDVKYKNQDIKKMAWFDLNETRL